jgi:uncharacterized membrane protein YagU involved in acid resistance
MASETGTDAGIETEAAIEVPWTAGVVASVVAGAVMGVMLTTMMRPVIAAAIPALWGLDGLTAGWLVHLVNSAIFGVVFAAVAVQPSVRGYVDSLGSSLATGVVYGVAVWVVGAVVVMPLWLQAVGFPNAPALPNVSMGSLVGHVVYGAVLGLVFPYLAE